MLTIRIAVRNLALNRRRSLLIGTLIGLGVLLGILGNSLFDSATTGLRTTFVDCFTADLFVSARGDEPLSLFGTDTPVIGSYAPIPTLPFHDRVLETVQGQAGVALTASQLSSYALLEAGETRNPIMLFGVDGEAYFRMFPAIAMRGGSPLRAGAPGVMISLKLASEIGRSMGGTLTPGAQVRLSTYTNRGFAIREVPLAGFFEYPSSNAVLDRIAYVDAATLRMLNGAAREKDVPAQLPGEATSFLSGDLEGVFDSAGDEGRGGAGLSLTEVEQALSDTTVRAPVTTASAGSWNFILLRLEPGVDPRAFRLALEREFAREGLDVRVGDWKAAAGSGAALAGSLSAVFNLGLGLLAVVIVLILTNTFVIWVTQRTAEIATMRALGASKGFVFLLFFQESAILSTAAGLVGLAVGSVIVSFLHRRGLSLDNRLLTLVFGGTTLRPLLTARTAVVCFLGALIVGCASIVLPVRLALRVQPARGLEAE